MGGAAQDAQRAPGAASEGSDMVQVQYDWSQDEVAKLRVLVAEGLTGSAIARSLSPGGGLSRNAVVGKASRLGLKLGVGRSDTQFRSKKTRTPKVQKRIYRTTEEIQRTEGVLPTVSFLSPPTVSGETGVLAAVMSLTRYTCRWPIGDPREDDFRFCCEPVSYEDRYCPAHKAISFMPSRVRDRRKEKV